MNHRRTGKSHKPRSVERQDRGEAVHLHRGNQARIVSRLARYGVFQHEGFSHRIDSRRVRQEEEHTLDAGEFRGSLSRSHAEAVLSEWTRRDHP